jgi:hypothetical protein
MNLIDILTMSEDHKESDGEEENADQYQRGSELANKACMRNCRKQYRDLLGILTTILSGNGEDDDYWKYYPTICPSIYPVGIAMPCSGYTGQTFEIQGGTLCYNLPVITCPDGATIDMRRRVDGSGITFDKDTIGLNGLTCSWGLPTWSRDRIIEFQAGSIETHKTVWGNRVHSPQTARRQYSFCINFGSNQTKYENFIQHLKENSGPSDDEWSASVAECSRLFSSMYPTE